MSKLKSRVIYVNKRRTSVRQCQSEWVAFEDICLRESTRRNILINTIENNKNKSLGLTSAIRLFSTIYYHAITTDISDKAIKKDYLTKSIKRIG